MAMSDWDWRRKEWWTITNVTLQAATKRFFSLWCNNSLKEHCLRFFSQIIYDCHSSTNTHRGYLQTGNHHFLSVTSVSECRHTVTDNKSASHSTTETLVLTGLAECKRRVCMSDTSTNAFDLGFVLTGSTHLWERMLAAGAVRWPEPAGSAKHWD